MLPPVVIGSTTIDMYLTMMGVATILNVVYVHSCRKKTQLTICQSILFVVCLGTIFFGGVYAFSPSGSLLIFGGFIMVPLGVPILKRLFKLPEPMIQDITSICMLIDVSSMKIGCAFAGCCEGIVLYVGNTYFQWPAQIIGSLLGITILVCLLRIDASGKKQGALYPLFMLSYGVGRFFLDFLEYMPLYWGLRRSQWFALVIALIGFIWLMVYKNGSKNE